MKNYQVLALLSVFVFFGCASGGLTTSRTREASVIRCSRGDTCLLVVEGLSKEVQLPQVETLAPETNLGATAIEVTRAFLTSGKVAVACTAKELEEKNVICDILSNNSSLSEELLKKGMGKIKVDKPTRAYVELENQAKESKLGIWKN